MQTLAVMSWLRPVIILACLLVNSGPTPRSFRRVKARKSDGPPLLRSAREFLLVSPLASARSLLSVAHPMHCLDIVGMIVSPGSARASWIDVVGHDVVVVGEIQVAEGAFPALLDDLAVEDLPHFCI